MNLEEKIRQGKLSRRDFVQLGLTGLTALALGQCGKNGPTTPEPPVPKPVAIRATFFNHTQGPTGEKTYSGMSGQPLVIKASDIYASNVDSQRIAVRKAGTGSGLGRFVGFSRNGEVNTTYPNQSMDYDVFLMNTSARADYQLIDNWVGKGAGMLLYSPDAKWQREDRDGATGPEEPINDAINQLNAALNYSWKKYGNFIKVSSSGNFGVGYCFGGNYHSSTWAGADARYNPEYHMKLRIFLEEIFELQTQTDDLIGDATFPLITDYKTTGNLNAIGRDLLAYVYVKDSKT